MAHVWPVVCRLGLRCGIVESNAQVIIAIGMDVKGVLNYPHSLVQNDSVAIVDGDDLVIHRVYGSPSWRKERGEKLPSLTTPIEYHARIAFLTLFHAYLYRFSNYLRGLI